MILGSVQTKSELSPNMYCMVFSNILVTEWRGKRCAEIENAYDSKMKNMNARNITILCCVGLVINSVF